MHSFKFVFSLLFAVFVSACGTTGILNDATDRTDLIYEPVIDSRDYSIKMVEYTATTPKTESLDVQRIDLNNRLRAALLAEFDTSAIPDTDFCRKTKVMDQNQLHACFERLSDTAKRRQRNALLDLGLSYSDKNCTIRADKTSNVLSAGNAITDWLITLGSTAGLAASDANTARAASGAVGAVNSMWNSSKDAFVRGSNFTDMVNLLDESRQAKATELRTKAADADVKYDDWPIMQVIAEVVAYDNSCDFFN